MATAPKRYIADDELASLMEEAIASHESVWIVAGDKTYRVFVEAIGQDAPDPATVARSIEGIRAAAGGWKGLVDEDFKDYIAERRRMPGRRPVDL